jgi:hypothetical protein
MQRGLGIMRESWTQAMTQYAYPPEPLLSSSEGMERVLSSEVLDEVKAAKMAVKASISDQEFAMLKGR